ASFEPTIDYVVVKIPKWAFEKFPGVEDVLGTQMKSVGEVMAIGRTFKEAFLKGVRSLERRGSPYVGYVDDETLRRKLIIPNAERIHYLHAAFERGWTVNEIYELTGVDPWFLTQLRQIADLQEQLKQEDSSSLSTDQLRAAKRMGFSDARIADFIKSTEDEVRERRKAAGIIPVYKRVDTCGAEFESFTPYLYSTYESECEAAPNDRKKIMILGSGPNRIGQGIEFDYCCCHAAFALKEDGYETIMVNCNPETVSTDYDTSDRLYFEPLTFEDVMHIVELEKPDGVIVQFGGQTPLNLAMRLHKAGVPIIGTSPESIDLAEDRKRFGKLLADLNIPQPVNGTAVTVEEAKRVAASIGYPVLVRPSYVLGGRAMMIVYDEQSLEGYMKNAVEASPEKPVLIDRFLEDAFEVDVDALADGEACVVAGIQEHIEEAGIHSGDSSCVLPPYMVKPEHLETMRRYTRQLAKALEVRGLMNIQFAIKDDIVYVLEVNPRASRTVPFVSKATGVQLAKIAARVMTGRMLSEFNLPDELAVSSFFIKEPVFPFVKFPGVDPVLGPEMRSTGEVMGMADTFGLAFAKAQMGANASLPLEGTAFISVNDNDKKNAVRIAKRLHELGFRIIATRGTAGFLNESGVPAERVFKVNEGRPNVVDLIKSDEIDLIVNTSLGRASFYDERAIRRAAMQYNVVTFTTLTGANAAASAIAAMRQEGRQESRLNVISLQEHHA
ncbi:MAG: carbamoyl-phosphate synthase large subunit, partial [Acidobacteria bacterium]|nr:carbamoyl-phosphate synthase large subunit [Acidobacteriota bacterium]